MPYLVDGHKICTKCDIDKLEDEYYKNKSSKDGHMLACKECINGYQKSDKGKEVSKRTRRKNIDRIRKCDAEYRRTEAGKASVRKTRKKRKENGKTNEYTREKRRNDINLRLSNNLRLRIWKALNGVNKSDHTIKLLGCSIDEFVVHISNLFMNGMTWDNYGELWHIDHDIPCDYFDLSITKNQQICFNHLNMQPMWSKDNISKSNIVPNDVKQKIEKITEII